MSKEPEIKIYYLIEAVRDYRFETTMIAGIKKGWTDVAMEIATTHPAFQYRTETGAKNAAEAAITADPTEVYTIDGEVDEVRIIRVECAGGQWQRMTVVAWAATVIKEDGGGLGVWVTATTMPAII